MKNQVKLEWSNFGIQVTRYYTEYFRHFITLNPSYIEDLKNILFPLFLEIYECHQNFEEVTLGKHCFYQAVNLVNKDIFAFHIYARHSADIRKDEHHFENCCKFVKEFLSFLKKYHLYNEGFSDVANHALASIVYYAVFKGEPYALNYAQTVTPSYPKALLEEMWGKRQKADWVKFIEKKILSNYPANAEIDEHDQNIIDRYKQNIEIPRILPPAESFQFYPPYDLFLSFKEYEENAVEAYRKHILSYLEEVKTKLKKHGIKRFKRDDYSQIKRLVIWNQHNFEKLWEILPYIPEFENIDPNNEIQVKTAVDVLRKSFKKYESFNLPVRPYGKKRKN
ncbi:MAG TPA: hypothetical protein PKY59_20935 [Pyrinomonadaceae bacterium]|nr:hypothetical protein [Pyrinomonadaceae bacterium]